MTTSGTVTTKTRGTTLVYRVPKINQNGESERFTVCVSNCLTQMINVTPVYENTGADQIANEVSIELTGIVHGFGERTPGPLGNYAMGLSGYGTSQFGVLDTADEAEKGRATARADRLLGNLEKVLAALSQPRGHLQYSINDTIVYNIAPRTDAAGYDEHRDPAGDVEYTGLAIDQTPKIEASVVKVISDTSAHIKIKATFIYQSCNIENISDVEKASERKQVKSLRWWYADDIDGNTWATRRMIRGRLEIYDREDLNVMTLRRLVLPPIEWGYRRDHIAIQEQNDGMAMDFEIIDVEAYAHAPFPASNWDGSTRMTFSPNLIGPIDIAAQIMLEAPIPRQTNVPGFNKHPVLFPTKEHLIHLLINMLDAKLHWHKKITGGNVFTKQLNISESMKRNKVEASLGLQVTVESETVRNTAAEAEGASNFRKVIRAVFANDMSYSEDRRIGYPNAGGTPVKDTEWGLLGKGQTLGHTNGISWYDRRLASYWQPHDGSLKGILKCALQNPCSYDPKNPNDFTREDRSQVAENNNQNQEFNYDESGVTDTGAKIPSFYQQSPRGFGSIIEPGTEQDQRNDSVYRSLSGETILSKLTASNNKPYFNYELATTYKMDNGLTAFPSKGPTVGVPNGSQGNGALATTIAHYTRGATAEVTIELNASRMGEWPTTPTEQSWIDPETGIMYMCKNLQVTSTSVELDATGNHKMYHCGARVTYCLSRPPKWFEPLRIGAAPFISLETKVDPRIDYYVKTLSRKSGARYVPATNNIGD
jgi:hypothetical protein